ncbi:MAG: stage III sporulation protein AB [Peptococcaceae bacterium]|nr:stage III sporulation protein AB [Peptococcaceae bacterium]
MLVIGYLGLIIGFGSLGLLQAMRIRKRPREIREFVQALVLLDTEIYWGATPLPAAFSVLKEWTESPWKEFFGKLEQYLRRGENAWTSWEKACKEQQKKTCLLDEDWGIIRGIGKGLGRSDRCEQHKNLELAQKQLAHADEKARLQADSKAKMWSYLGFLGGMVIVIFIM